MQVPAGSRLHLIETQRVTFAKTFRDAAGMVPSQETNLRIRERFSKSGRDFPIQQPALRIGVARSTAGNQEDKNHLCRFAISRTGAEGRIESEFFLAAPM